MTWFSTNLHKSLFPPLFSCVSPSAVSRATAHTAPHKNESEREREKKKGKNKEKKKRDKLINKKPIKRSRIVKSIKDDYWRNGERRESKSQKAPKYFFKKREYIQFIMASFTWYSLFVSLLSWKLCKKEDEVSRLIIITVDVWWETFLFATKESHESFWITSFNSFYFSSFCGCFIFVFSLSFSVWRDFFFMHDIRMIYISFILPTCLACLFFLLYGTSYNYRTFTLFRC